MCIDNVEFDLVYTKKILKNYILEIQDLMIYITIRMEI